MRLLANRLARSLTSPGIGFSTLSAHWQASTMTQTAVAAKVKQTLDVHRHLTTQVTFNCDLTDRVTQSIELTFIEVTHFGIFGYAGICTQLLGCGFTDAVNIGLLYAAITVPAAKGAAFYIRHA